MLPSGSGDSPRPPGPRRTIPAAVHAGAAALAALAVTACAPDAGPHVEGAAPDAAPGAVPVYVSDAAGQPLERPERFGITESASLTALTWDSWGGTEATAAGSLSGVWCLPDCPDDGYPVEVELREPERTERVAYYTWGAVTPDRAASGSADDADALPPAIVEELADLELHVPGTEEPSP